MLGHLIIWSQNPYYGQASGSGTWICHSSNGVLVSRRNMICEWNRLTSVQREIWWCGTEQLGQWLLFWVCVTCHWAGIFETSPGFPSPPLVPALPSDASLDAPVGEVVVLVSFTNEGVTDEFAKVQIVRLVAKVKSMGIVSLSKLGMVMMDQWFERPEKEMERQ